jgi:hypothetical protein
MIARTLYILDGGQLGVSYFRNMLFCYYVCCYICSLSSRVSDLDVLREREVNNVKHSVILQVLVLYL